MSFKDMPTVTSTTTSSDGATIAYRSLGQGPDVLIVHGAMQSSASQLELAGLLAGDFRVHLMDRRGRVASSGTIDGLREVDDVRAVLAATGARRLLGVSSGALLAARAALVVPDLERLVLFEPPLAIADSIRVDLLPRFDDAIAAGRLAQALAWAMKISEMGPPWMFRMPAWVLAAVSGQMVRGTDERAVEARRLAQALQADFAIVRANADRLADFAKISCPTLLIDGTATRPYLRLAVEQLGETIPGARRVSLPGQNHSVTQNADQFGHPEVVAPVLQEFLAD